jgi:outer membrane protein
MNRLSLRLFIALPLVALVLLPQDSIESMSFRVDKKDLLETPSLLQPKSWFLRHIQPDFPKVELRGATRLSDFLVGGKLELSLKNYLELVLENNTDIQIQKLGVEPQRNAITRAMAAFDPQVNTSFRSTRNTQLPTSSVAGGSTVTNLTQPFSLGYDQTLQNGTAFNLTYNFQKVATSSNNATFNPSLTSTMQMSFTQPLMRNRGRSNQMIPVMVAKVRQRSAELNAEDQIQRLVQTAELAYWAVVEAREALKVQETALATQDQFLKRSQRELELGAISPLDIYQPQQTYASQEVQVAQARYRLIQSEDAFRRQMGADLDPAFSNTPIVLTETVLPPSDESQFDREALVTTAYGRRPDLKATQNNLTVDDLNARTARNSLMPDVSLTGNFSGTGRGGTELVRSGLVGGVTGINPVGISPALSNTFAFNYPTYGGGLTIRFPVRDSRASADLADATVNKRLDTLRIRQSQQNIRQEVLNAVTQVESSRASVKLAQVAMDFSQKRLEAEQKKYDLGVTTIFFLLDAQTQLTNAQANVVTQSVQYRRNLLALLRVTGQLLEDRGIQVK